MTEAIDVGKARTRWGTEVEQALHQALACGGLLEEMGRYHFETGGKRLRALLPLMVCHNLGGDWRRALPYGVALEMIHNATLVHDDLQDGDTTRRGAPTVWARWGVAQAINSGDALFFQGLQAMARVAKDGALMTRTCEAVMQCIAGQVMEFELQGGPEQRAALSPSLAVWELLARKKTGALFGLSLAAGASAADSDEATVAALARYGEDLGVLFQVQDDLLDLTGDKGRTEMAQDLAEGKMSYPVAWAYEHAALELQEELIAIVRRPRDETSEADITRGLALLELSGALEATCQRVAELGGALNEDKLQAFVPGLVTRILAPVAHVLNPDGVASV